MMTGGDLEDKSVRKGQLKANMVPHIAYQICYGLKYMHEMNIVHRDIKPGNVLCFINPSKCSEVDVQVKLADFGLSGLLDPESDGFNDFLGSDDHMAPEIITLK